ncbi:efflux RND transporter periplasmic adaptor subunit [Candidatus Protochlamydia phocaeensis]|uniref:efflux RND transporter periplasmic adaptor subunit n=1 Tax=Candidatus Protochlamydia phocaeensis TaxID=1414722 RepID=UPI0008390412|nr:efflux RND transporter periplasmic adaptor subunit [Candidatus Protochlamydia phocaeensis]
MRRFVIFLIFLLFFAGAAYALWVIFQEKPKEANTLILYGNVDVRQVDLGFRVLGRVQSMPFEEGDFVPKGHFMAALDKQPYEDQVKQAQAHVASVSASLNNAERLVKRRQQLIGTGAVSSEDYEDAISSREVYQANLKEAQAALGVAMTNLQDTVIYAPSDGTILTRIREPGAIVREADPIYTLSLTSPIWVRAYVSEPDLGKIYPGMPAEVLTDTSGSPVYRGHIGFISPVAEFTPKTVETTQLRTDLVYRLRIIADNPDNGLRQGMPVTVKLRLKQQSPEERP